MRKIYSLLILFGIVSIVVGSGAIAYFSDTEKSTGNTFTDGTLDLKVVDPNEPTSRDGVTATWTMTNMIPDVTVTGGYVTLKNSGSTAADHVEISFSHSIDEATNPVESDTNPNSTAKDLAKWIEITLMGYVYGGGIDFLHTPRPQLTEANENGFIDLDDVTRPANSDALDNLPAPSPLGATTTTLMIFLKFNAGATNDIQGDTLTTNVIFPLNQVASQ